MMASVLAPLVFGVLLTGTLSVLLLSPGAERASPCPPRWHQFGERCFAFHPVWSSWHAAESLCSQTGYHLASPHTPGELLFVSQLADTHTPVWLGGYHKQQNASDPTNQTAGMACMQMDPKSGELDGAPCEELSFYICSTNTSSEVFAKNNDPVQPQMVPNVSLFDVMWGESNMLAVEVLHSSSFLKELWSGRLTQGCYARFMQQEALYLHRVSSTLEVLLSGLQEADDMRSLLMDTLKHYSSRNQSLLDSPPPLWLQLSLRSFHSVVLEEPVYWVVALLARASLRNFLAEELQMSEVRASSFYQEWSDESRKEFAWTQRYRKAIEEHQDQMHVYKAIDIFRDHMMNQRNFYKAVDCDVGGEQDGKRL
ncbi:uncharacterized protein LOC104935543 isoform X2 [Larimichthys crocea]|uniref:uncharacterized protein LOC104935543 isoform X2 n=1 Tax=Larimichthys crocea TaxID=215358 RepID=UPI000F5EA8B0|nr:uncharacterized protein LOC104935543 isoform X2 [Larimichthys crocea]